MSVNKDKWADRRNRLPPRFLTRDKDADLRRQIASLESLGLVERSTASEYSQVHLVRKPDNSWRLCIDCKNLNDATESIEVWPLQNIPIMVDRVTRQRPRFYVRQDGHDIRVLLDIHRCPVMPIHGVYNVQRPIPMVPAPYGTQGRSLILPEDDG